MIEFTNNAVEVTIEIAKEYRDIAKRAYEEYILDKTDKNERVLNNARDVNDAVTRIMQNLGITID